MNKHVHGLALLSLVLMILIASCREIDECIPNVFLNEDLYMEANIDGYYSYISDSSINHIFPGQNYYNDTARVDTMIFNFTSYYIFDGETGVVALNIVEYVDYLDVIDYGLGNYNYSKFDSLIVEGDFEYTARSSTAPDYGVDVIFTFGNSLVYNVDTSAVNPEDFYFNVNSYVKSTEKDCYSRLFEWITYTGTFGCRLVDFVTSDTIIIKDGEFRAVAAQYK